MPATHAELIERIEARSYYVERGYETPCRVTTLRPNAQGYGQISNGVGELRRMLRTHVVVWTWHHGPVPEGLEIHHLCSQRDCHELSHLQATTHRVNTLLSTAPSAMHAKKTHCVHGHPLSGENLRVAMKEGRPVRECRQCGREKSRRQAQQKRRR